MTGTGYYGPGVHTVWKPLQNIRLLNMTAELANFHRKTRVATTAGDDATAPITTPPPVWSDYAAAHEVPCDLESANEILGVIGFGSALPRRVDAAFPALSIPVEPFGATPRLEVWHGTSPITRGTRNGVDYAHNGAVLFGTLALSEPPSSRLETTTFQAYTRLLEVIRTEDYPHLLRMWNYFPSINLETHGLERYRQFCVGRHQAFTDYGYAHGCDLPAASAIGSRGAGLHIYFLACRTPGTAIENPRQMSAYRYPPEYGPRQPTFSRAISQRWENELQIYISGTASIVGHASRHRDDLPAQIEETLRNMRALLQRVSTRRPPCDLTALASAKVYLRRPADLQPAMEILSAALDPDSPVLYLEGDICRSELLIEIEGVVRLPCGRDAGTGNASTP